MGGRMNVKGNSHALLSNRQTLQLQGGNLTVVDPVEIFRLFDFVLACLNGWWSKGSFWRVLTNRKKPLTPYGIIVFAMSGMAASFSLNHWAGVYMGHGDGYWSWKLLSFALLGYVLAQTLYGRLSGNLAMMEELTTFLECLGDAQAIRDLRRTNPKEADRLTEEAKRLTIAALVLR